MIIGLIGPIGHGKTTAARHLEKSHRFIRGSFAESLKRTCYHVFVPLGAAHRHFYGSQADKSEPIPALGGVTGRRILELVGTNGFRAAYPDVWVRFALECEYPLVKRLVFEDVRFPNEATTIRNHGGRIVRVVAQGKPIPETGHESDRAWRAIIPDHEVLVPNGDLAGLRAALDALDALVLQ